MGILELIFLAVALSMDAFAVAICKGLSLKKVRFTDMAIVGLYFGIFQAAMPAIGYYLTTLFRDYIQTFSSWIAFALLAFLGGKMIFESLKKDDGEEKKDENPLRVSNMLVMSLATSIDALAVGVTFAVLELDGKFPIGLLPSVGLIGVTTFLFSAAGVKLGSIFGAKYENKAEFVGGVVLCALGLKILLEYYGILPELF